VPTRTTRVLAGVALAALAAAGVAAAVNYRRGVKSDLDERAHLDELDARLEALATLGSRASGDPVGRIFDGLQRNRGISVGRLRSWIVGVRQGSLSSDQAVAAESDFGALEREADQGGV
jgi:hypothetical protein